MKMKKTSKLMLAASTMAVALSFTTGAFADAAFSTVTTYDFESGKIAVESQVTGLAANDEVAYLVTKADGTTPVFIDQATVVEGTATKFNFKTSKDNANVQAQIRLGSMSGTAIGNGGNADNSTIKLGTYTITVINGTGGTATAQTDRWVDGKAISGDTVTFDIVVEAGYELAGIKVNGVAQTVVPGASTFTTDKITKDTTVEFTYQSTTTVDPIVTYSKSIVSGTGADANVSSLATATKNNELSECGILFAKDRADLESVTMSDITTFEPGTDLTGKVVAFKALETTADGKFVIRLVDGGSQLLEDGYATRAYAIYGDKLILADNIE